MTTPSLLTRLQGAFTDTTVKKAYRDPIINPGTRLLFDASSPYSLPLTTGAISAGQTLANMVDSAPTATPSSSSDAMSNNGFDGTGKHLGISMAGTAGSNTFFTLGTSYNLQALGTPNHDFLVLTWLRLNTAQVAATNFSQILSLGGATNNLFNIDAGASNVAPRACANAHSSVPGHAAFTGFVFDVPQQLGVAYKWNNGLPFFEIYLNGALVTTVNDGAALAFSDQSANSMNWGYSRLIGKLYAAYLEDLVVSGASALAQVQADYAFRLPRFAA